MFAQLLSIGIITLLGAMLPGPDFAIVTKNSLLYSRVAGYFTALGIGAAIFVHMSYCVLGLAIVISQSLILFSLIKYVGASYLIYLGITSLLAKETDMKNSFQLKSTKKNISNATAFRQGFLCNLLNPKATLFFLAIFTVVIKPTTSFDWQLTYALEIILISIIWFSFLSILLSHSYVKRLLKNAEKFIAKILGVFLIGFGTALAFVKH